MNKTLYHKAYWLYHFTAVIRIHFYCIVGKAHKQIDIIKEHYKWEKHHECKHNWIPYVWNIEGESFKCTKCGKVEK